MTMSLRPGICINLLSNMKIVNTVILAKKLSCLSALLGLAKFRRLYQTAYLQISASILLRSSSLRVFQMIAFQLL